ncbi:MAG: preprotein translocase subunit SecA [Anaerolineae bacterium]
MFKKLLTRVMGDPNEREVRSLQPIIDEINQLENEMKARSDADLRGQTEEFRRRVAAETAALAQEAAEAREAYLQETDTSAQQGLRAEWEAAVKAVKAGEREVLDAILPTAFAAVREAARRTIGLRHYDVQLIGGIVLHQGKIAEMRTGEGKTLVATLPLYLNALARHGAHLVTPNDYLSKIGAQWMGPVYSLLGVSVGVIQSAAANPDLGSFVYDHTFQSADDRYQFLRPVSRRAAYEADVTYGTNNEFGFDYLRDNMIFASEEAAQNELHFAIVDEVDNILIDEARTPLIISGQAQESSDLYRIFAGLVKRLRLNEDYLVEEKERVVTLTEEGVNKIEGWLGIDNLYSAEHFEKTPYLDNALRAHVLYSVDRDYIVKDGEVIIVDEFTGRLMHGRRFSEGLHQAIEGKEGVRVQRESLTLATITFQNFFRMYHKLAGMTGTAATEAEEFSKIYQLDVTMIPTNIEYRAKQGELTTRTEKVGGADLVTYEAPATGDRYFKRLDSPDLIYKNQEAKFRAVVKDVAEMHKQGRPVLVGTVAIETSEMLASMLKRHGVPHSVLNAKQHEREAIIIAQAGRPGNVTIATNMAGRGVDILLGGNAEGMARDHLRKQGHDLINLEPGMWEQALAEAEAEVKRNRQLVWELGGLHVIGTERHEARRIDNQLRGRAARQGDPGSSRFYLSLSDDLMRRFGGENVASLMNRLGVEDDMPIEHNLVSKTIANAQVRVEGFNFDIRKHVLEYDDVVNKQREIIYDQRRQILTKSTMRPTILGMIENDLTAVVKSFTSGQDPADWDITALHQTVIGIMPVPDTAADWQAMAPDELTDRLCELAEQTYDAKEAELGAEWMRHAERHVMLSVVDHRWQRHLTDLDQLREGIGLRAFAQVEPLLAYKKEAFEMYQGLMADIQHDIVRAIFHVQQARPEPVRRVQQLQTNRQEGEARPVRRSGSTIGRNDPCWCGSGKKYKQCHMASDHESGATPGGPPAPAPAAVKARPAAPVKRARR